jgi:hypothetical protein
VSDLIYHDDPQGSEAWLAARRGVITASRFKDARDKLKGGAPSKACLGYAMDIARERVGGTAPSKFVTAAMRTGSDEEQFARIEYMARTGCDVQQVGFVTTNDRKFGVSSDGLVVGTKGAIEIKSMVSSDTLFRAMVDGDVSEYADQCNGEMWLLHLDWIDLVLWSPDIPGCEYHVTRLTRDEKAIDELVDELVSFERLVCQYEAKLRAKLTGADELATARPAAPKAPAAAPTPQLLPESIFG